MSEFIDIFVKFSNLSPVGGAFDSLLCLKGRVFVQNDCPGGGDFCSLQVVGGGGGVVMDEIDTCSKYETYRETIRFMFPVLIQYCTLISAENFTSTCNIG